MIIKPQQGPQELFLRSTADIAIYGGAAGGGKTFALLLEPLRYVNVKGFNATIFRRNATQISIDGGLLDESMSIYGLLKGASYKASPRPHWTFGDSKISFMHIDGDRDLHKWQGSQICCEVNTPILMADGSFKPLGRIKVGDKVQTLEGVRSITFADTPIIKDCVKLTLPNGDFQIQSTDHKVLTSNGWLSYEDFSQSIEGYNNQVSFEYKRNSHLILDKLVAVKHCHQGNIERFFEHSPALRQLFLAPFVYRKLYEFRQLSICAPTLLRAFDKFARKFALIPPSMPLFLDNHNDHLSLILTLFLSLQDRQCSSAIASHTALSIQDNVFSRFLHTFQVVLPHILYPLDLVIPILLVSPVYQVFAPVLILDEGLNVALLSSLADCLMYHLTCCHSYGELLHQNANNVLNSVQLPSGVVVQIQTDWLSYETDKVPNNTPHKLHYVHPYKGVSRCSEVVHSLQSLNLTPCGKHFVRNICVDSANHYITKAGIVNRNCYIGFDELTHFSANTFFYMLSRNRSTCGVKPYVRATCNPDADSWVADFIDFWIDQESGYPLKERSGLIRYFVRIDGEIKWADSPIELAERYNINQSMAKSVTFIASSIFDNKVLLEKDQGYLANLNGLPIVERERLLKGNWKIKPSAGLYFKRSQTKIVNELPAEIVNIVRAWDLAATEITTSNKNPDRTCGVLMARLSDDSFIILDVKRVAFSASNVRSLIKQVSQNDRDEYNCRQIRIPQDPGQAGKDQAQSYVRELAGFNVKTKVITGDKVIRAEPLAAQWQIGNVLLLNGSWNETFITEMEGFPELLHDDQVDAAADAFSALATAKKSVSKFDLGLR